MALRQWLMWAGLLASLGCAHSRSVDALPDLSLTDMLASASARRVPDAVRSRFSIKMHSPKLGISAPPLGGGLVIDRPERVYLAVLPPVGAPVLTAATDASGTLRLLNAHDKQYVESFHFDEELPALTDGAMHVQDAVSLLLGLLPFHDAAVNTRHRDKNGQRIEWSLAPAVRVEAWLDPARGTPSLVRVHGKSGTNLLEAAYDTFQWVEAPDKSDAWWMPSRVRISVPSAELTLDVRFKTWSPLTEVPDVFSPAKPEGWESRTLAEFGKGASSAASGLEGASEPDAP